MIRWTTTSNEFRGIAGGGASCDEDFEARMGG